MTMAVAQQPQTRCSLAQELEARGIVVIPDLLERAQLAEMQRAFDYIVGSHGKQAPRSVRKDELTAVPSGQILDATGPAGTVILFDTSGIHRQSVPILEPRQAVFLNYHDPKIPLQREDVEYYRYHPLLLNAAFLGGLSDEDCKILGFGNKTNYQPGYVRRSANTWQRGLAA